jgi:hypothetical protein
MHNDRPSNDMNPLCYVPNNCYTSGHLSQKISKPLQNINTQVTINFTVHKENPTRCNSLSKFSFQRMKWKTNRCHYFNFIHISTDLYMFRAYRTILRRIHTAVHTTIGSVAVPFVPRALYVVTGLGYCREQSPRPATTYRARGLNGTATEPTDVWTSVWILLRIGL